MGSPSLLLWQPPPKPYQRVLPAVGPEIRAPLDLLNTANEVFTHCTYWVLPTVPLVSGGAPVTLNPYCPAPRPSKLWLTIGVRGVKANCRTGSSPSGVRPGGSGIWRTGSASCGSREAGGAYLIISRKGGETSRWTSCRTVIPVTC